MAFLLLFLVFPVAFAAQDKDWLALHNAGTEALSKGRYADGRSFLAAAWEEAKQFDPADQRRGLSAYSLATACELQGDVAQAEALLTEAVSMFEANGVDARSRLAIAVDALGDVRFEQGRFTDAEELYNRGLALNRETRGDADGLTALSFRHLGVVYEVLNKPLEAEDAFKHSIRIFRGDTSVSKMGLGNALEGLGRLYLAQRRYDDAEALMKESLDCKKELPDQHPSRADAMLNLAMVYRLKGDLARAEPLLRKALAIYEKTSDPHRLSALSELAGLATDEKKYKTAERYMSEVLKSLIQSVGPDHPSVATAGKWLANVYAFEGRFAQAETLVQRSLEIERKTYGDNHPEVVKSLALLAAIQAKSRHTIGVGEQALFPHGSSSTPR